MTYTKHLMIIPLVFSLFLIPNSMFSFADHDHESSGEGGCSGDCTPPTLGIDNAEIVHVKGGFSINDKSFDVAHFKQHIETQFVESGLPVEITLKVFENSGPVHLKHVGLMLGEKQVFRQYVWVTTHDAQIHWEKTFDGIQHVEIENPNNLITDVSVDTEVDE